MTLQVCWQAMLFILLPIAAATPDHNSQVLLLHDSAVDDNGELTLDLGKKKKKKKKDATADAEVREAQDGGWEYSASTTTTSSPCVRMQVLHGAVQFYCCLVCFVHLHGCCLWTPLQPVHVGCVLSPGC